MVWITKIKFEPKDYDRILKVLEDTKETAKKRGEEFSYNIVGNTVLIYSNSKDIAHKRGLLFTKKYLKDLNLFYNVEWKRV